MPEVPRLPVARELLRRATADLADSTKSVQHDLWQGDVLNVAPIRSDTTAELRQKGVRNFTADDLDNVMFRVMTTMGGEASFQFFLPRFLTSVLTFPEFLGWVTTSHVLLSKLQLVDLRSWKKLEKAALFAALEAFAIFEWSIYAGDTSEPLTEPDEGVRELLEFVRLHR